MINREEIIEALAPLNFWGREQYTGIKRKTYISCLEKLSKVRGKALAIIGVRRSGKTTILKQFIQEKVSAGAKKEQTLYINFEDPTFIEYLNARFLDEAYNAYRALIEKEGKPACIALDEIQNVYCWEKWIRIMQEKRENVCMLITGSSSKLLSSELATALTGRALKLTVFPLSFSEFVQFKGDTIEIKQESDLLVHKERLRKLLAEYMQYGGFPEVVLSGETSKLLILKGYFEDIINKDIVTRFGVKNAKQTKVIAEMAINSFSSLLSANSLRKTLTEIFNKKISPNTIVNSLGYLEDAQLVFYNPLLSYKVKEQKLYPKKAYCIDPGLVNAVSLFGKNLGRLYENIVAVELKRLGKEVYYWKNSSGKEVDFVVKEGTAVKKLINVCYDISKAETKKREISGLLAAMEEFRLKEGTIITENYEAQEVVEKKKVIYVPLWKYLLRHGFV
ncbi:MAG: ATP-binding protein [Candidatus Woesearchaeota archaeon]